MRIVAYSDIAEVIVCMSGTTSDEYRLLHKAHTSSANALLYRSTHLYYWRHSSSWLQTKVLTYSTITINQGVKMIEKYKSYHILTIEYP